MAGDEVRVEMGEEDVTDLEPEPFCIGDILMYIALRIDDDGCAALFIAKQVRGMGEAAEVILFQDHGSSRSLAPMHRGGQRESYCFLAFPLGSANATYMPPCGSLGVRALLVAITTYWRPSTM